MTRKKLDLDLISKIERAKLNPTNKKIIQNTIHKPLSITELGKKLDIKSYRYVWEKVKELEKLHLITTFKQHDKKGQPLMVGPTAYVKLQESFLNQMVNEFNNEIKSKGKTVINEYREFVIDETGEIMSKTDQDQMKDIWKNLVLKILMPSFYDDFDIIIKERKKKKHAKRKKA